MSDNKKNKPDYRLHEQRQEMLDELAGESPELAEKLEKVLETIDEMPAPWRLMLAVILRREVEAQYPATKQ